MSGRVCRMSRFIIRSREAGCLTRRRARPPMRACGCDHAAPPSAGWDESGSPEGAMTCLNGGPPLTVSGEDQPAAAEHLQQAPFMPAAPAGHYSRRSQAVLINFVFESVHRFPRGFNVNDFHRFPPPSHLQFARANHFPALRPLGDEKSPRIPVLPVGALPFAIFAKLLLCLWLRPRFPCSHQQSERAVPLARSPRDH